ncbi:hypothetical protein KIW84_073468 [Lathyrus oleraceus]|uniref:Uncharacterized protein n=1 Tax=Pisum sativum TaxID=3888 RepID=A0A9D4ZWQ4_PEA|nr:hypothetical protein KIW84_073468 [Pisum sativum]
MIASAPSDFIEMVNMGIRLEEGVHEVRLSKDEVSTSKKYVSSFSKRKDNKTNAISSGRQGRPQARRNPPPRQHHDHQGAPGHDIENCYPLKYEVKKLMKSGMVSFEDRAPNVKANPLPAHGNSLVNMCNTSKFALLSWD